MAESKIAQNYLEKLITDAGLLKITNFFGNNLEGVLSFKPKELKGILNLNDNEIKKVMEIKRNYEGGRIVKISKCEKTNTRSVNLVVSHSRVFPTTVPFGGTSINSLILYEVPEGVRLIFLAPLNRYGSYSNSRIYDNFSKLVKKGGNIYELVKDYFIKNNPMSRKQLEKDGFSRSNTYFKNKISKVFFEFTLKKPGEFYNNLQLGFAKGSYIECLNIKNPIKIPIENGSQYLHNFLTSNGKGIYIIGGCRRFNNFSSEQKIIARYIDNNSVKDRATLVREIKTKIKEYRRKKIEIEKLYNSSIPFKKYVKDVESSIKDANSTINIDQIKRFLYNLKLSYDADSIYFFNPELKDSICAITANTIISDKKLDNDYELASDYGANNDVKSFFRKIITPEIEEKKEDDFEYKKEFTTLKKNKTFGIFNDDELKKILVRSRGDVKHIVSLYSEGRGIQTSKRKKKKSKNKSKKTKGKKTKGKKTKGKKTKGKKIKGKKTKGKKTKGKNKSKNG